MTKLELKFLFQLNMTTGQHGGSVGTQGPQFDPKSKFKHSKTLSAATSTV